MYMSDEMLTSLIPIAIILVLVIARVVFMNGGNRGGGSIAGRAVCRRCGRAFDRPFLAPNLFLGKLLRCPHCGAWAVLPAASQAELDVADARDKPSQPEPTIASEPTDDDKLRRRIEQSKYE
jgi:hypothetical protein